jgi:hypothetical protein
MNTSLIKILITIFVIIHLVGSLWHGDAHTILEITLPRIKNAFIIVVIIIGPILGTVLTWTRFALPGCWMVGISMVGSVVFSVYHHYVLISNDNVEHLPAGTPEAHAHFSNSAELIALAALAAALLAFYAAGKLQVGKSGVA